MSRIEVTIAPFDEEFVVSHFARTHTKLPVKLKNAMVVLVSEVNVVSLISKKSSSVGVVRYNGLFDTIMTVAKEEGPMALMRGSVVRMLAHAPALGVSWTAYELCKKFVMEKFEF